MSEQPCISAWVVEGALAAGLRLGGPGCHTPVSPGQMLAAIKEAGIKPLSHWSEPLAMVLSRHRADPTRPIETELPGLPPTHGRDGRIDWADGLDPDNRHAARATHPDRQDFYSACPFTFVAEGQFLGTLHEPVLPAEGRDVLGQTLPPDHPEPLAIELGNGITRREDGALISQVDGVLHYEHPTVRVEPVLRIEEDVDFSTGHIRFSGDVVVGGSVCELFEVSAGGDVTIGKMVEAARVKAAGSVTIHAGMAGKEKGLIEAGGDVTTRYLTGMRGQVGGDLRVQGEIDHSELTIRGSLIAPEGRLGGSRVAVGADSEVGELGARSGQATELRLGYDPVLERRIRRLRSITSRLKQQMEEAEQTRARLMRIPETQRSTAQDRWLAKLTRRHTLLQRRWQRCQRLAGQLRDENEALSRVQVTVKKQLQPGTSISTPRARATIEEPMSGPLVIGQATPGQIGIRGENAKRWEKLLPRHDAPVAQA